MAIYLNNTTIKRGNSGIPIINGGESKPEQTKTAIPSLSQQIISPDSGYALSGVTVEPITSDLLASLDSDFKAENIAEGVDMFGVAGTHAGASNLQSKSVTYTANGTATITPDDGYDGLSSVDVTVNVSGGGSVETCTLTTSVVKAPGVVHGTIYAYSGDTLITIRSKGTYSINKNSLIYIDSAYGTDEVTGLEKLYYMQQKSVCNVTSDIATYNFRA